MATWVEKPENIQDDAWVTGYLYDDAAMQELMAWHLVTLTFRGTRGFAKVYDNANIGGDADHSVVCGNARVTDHAVVMGYAVVSGDAVVPRYMILFM